MTEDIIFQGQPKGKSQPVPPPSTAQQAVAVPVSQPQSTMPAAYEDEGGILSHKLVRIVAGVVGAFLFLFIIFFALTHLFHAAPSGPVTLTYWGLFEDDPTMQGIIQNFEKQHPDITINYKQNTLKDYRKKLTVQISNGNGPDIYELHNTWIPQMLSFLLPLSQDAISKDDFQKSFYPVTESDLVHNGAIYALPLEIDTLSLFVNTDIFHASGESVPSSWDDFQKVARALTVKDQSGQIKTAGAALGTSGNITHWSDILSLLLIQNGVDLHNLSGTSANAADALRFYTSFASGDGSVWSDTMDPSIQAFAEGKLAMYFGYSWDIFTLKALNPTLPFQIVEVPHLQGKNMTIASYWNVGISAKSKHPKEAMEFLSYVTSQEVEQKLFAEESKTRIFGEPYARKDLASLLQENQLLYPFLTQAPNAVSTFFASDTSDDGMNDVSNAYLANAVNATLGNTSPESAIDTLAQGISQALKQYGQ